MKDWEKRFAEKFSYSLWSDQDSLAVSQFSEVKSFISDLLEKQEERHREMRTKWAFKTVSECERVRQETIEEVMRLLKDTEFGTFDEWYKSTKKYGGTQEEYSRLELIINNENNLKRELRQQLKQMKGE